MSRLKIDLRSANIWGSLLTLSICSIAIWSFSTQARLIYVPPTALPTTPRYLPGQIRPTSTPYPLSRDRVDPTQVRWFIGLGGGAEPDQLAAELAVVDEFNQRAGWERHETQLVMEVLPPPSGSYSPQGTLRVEMNTGDGPDIIGPVGWETANDLPGVWYDLTALIRQTHYDTSQIDPALLDLARNHQGLVGLPFALYPAAVEYNADLFRKAGLQPPPGAAGEPYTLPDGSKTSWDWDTLAKVARLLTLDANGRNAGQPGFDARRIVQYGFSWGHEENPVLIASYWRAGSLLGNMGTAGTNSVTIPPAWKAAWQWDYVGMHGPQPFIAFGPSAPGAFGNGQAAMTIETVRYLPSFGKVKSFQFAPLPAYQGQITRRLEIETLRLWKGTKNPEPAFADLTYLLDQGVSRLLVSNNGKPAAFDGLPVHTADQQAFLVQRSEEYPWVKTWDVLLANTGNPQTPAGEDNMPNFTPSWARIAEFGTRMEDDPGLDLQAEEDSLIQDLTALFNK